jgi:peptidoglycan/LPS O-acetylase OafA/YrhL
MDAVDLRTTHLFKLPTCMSLTETIQKDNAIRTVKLHGLDHLRAFAIIIVFLFHYQSNFAYPAWFPKLFLFGRTGVDLFFVLSGFLIASQLIERIKQHGGFSLKEFYIKRFFRIIPVYLVVVAIYFCFPFFREKEGLPPLWKFLTFTQNLGIDLKNGGAFSHAWSLCVEEHFYVFFPVVLLFFSDTILKIPTWLLSYYSQSVFPFDFTAGIPLLLPM